MTLKRAAWAYGCAKKDTVEEREMLDRLIATVNALPRCGCPEQYHGRWCPACHGTGVALGRVNEEATLERSRSGR